ncbi:MAG: 4-aminobutyrate aminotransferase [Candidatus Wallbacteria bacterium GWC2_49_35]|uniref:4-aminobutyrate aminotransferase n=1 Tax=Candidatus Wallbacteria bacterium GWC2_49_35 TaxID=1817813 RepID=A0A1F7WMM6_9BACT|nr:MAG: 4-aminobutyrate aminotransferase [Candidatus Wallbacteria bacterium GWC2_49_35]HBC74382.1 aspartate aminotransferase family protein [Candidatus Wallbacteria bacterium]
MKYDKIIVKTELPGPISKKIIAVDEKFVSHSYTRDYGMVAKRGEGAFVEDPDGNVFLDFSAGIAVCSTGHCHPEIVETIKKQSEELIHMSGTDFYYETQVNLAEKMSKIVPIENSSESNPVMSFFGNSGAEAIEAVIKIARNKRRVPRMLAFIGAFHGRTIGALSLNGSKIRHHEHFHPLLPGVVHAPYAYCKRCPYGAKYPGCNLECVDFIKKTLLAKIISPDDISCLIMEAVQGEGGYVVPPVEFVKAIRDLTREHGILLAVDEVQSGMGRTGKMFAIEHFGVNPDIMAIAKGIASGLPLSITCANREVMNWKPGAHASTFGGNPVACAAANKTIELLEKGILANVNTVGAYLKSKLVEMQAKYEFIGDVRGLGLMLAIEIVDNKKDFNPDCVLRDKILHAAFAKGLIILGCGPNSVRFAPPLIVTKEHIDMVCGVLESVFAGLKK